MQLPRSVTLNPLVWALILALCSLPEQTGAASAESDPVATRGLRHTRTDRSTVEQAVNVANRLLATPGYRIDTSWAPSSAGASDVTSIPLFSIETKPDAPSTPAAVPKHCSCIFVDPRALRAWLKTSSSSSGKLALDPAHTLAFMLLHEVGHINQRTSGMVYENGSLSQLNVAPSVAKNHEDNADDFAASLVRETSLRRPVSDASISATRVASELVNLAWNLQAYRLLDKFGSTMISDPAVFFDQSYSHPNLEWRILRSNHTVQQTAISKELLDAFEDARARAQDPAPIYEAE